MENEEVSDLRDDLIHVLSRVEQHIHEAQLNKVDQQQQLNEVAEARHTAQQVKDASTLTDILTWALSRLEQEEGRQRHGTLSKSHSIVPGDKKHNHIYPQLIMGKSGWTIHAAPNGKAYWYHDATEKSVWDEPLNVINYRKQTEVDGWGVHPSPKGKPYWHNEITGASVWVEPEAMKKRREEYASLADISFARQTAAAASASSKREALSTIDSSDDDDASDTATATTTTTQRHGAAAAVMTAESNDPSVLKRLLNTTMVELEKSYATIHDLNEDRDALVEALDKVSVESEDIIHELRQQVKQAKKSQKNSRHSREQQGGGSSKMQESGEDSARTEALEQTVHHLKNENDILQREMDEMMDHMIELEKKVKRSAARPAAAQSPSTAPESPASPGKHRRTAHQPALDAGKSAKMLQSHMRGYLARKELERKVDDHLYEEIVIPDFSHLNQRRATSRHRSHGSSKYGDSGDEGGGRRGGGTSSRRRS